MEMATNFAEIPPHTIDTETTSMELQDDFEVELLEVEPEPEEEKAVVRKKKEKVTKSMKAFIDMNKPLDRTPLVKERVLRYSSVYHLCQLILCRFKTRDSLLLHPESITQPRRRLEIIGVPKKPLIQMSPFDAKLQ